MANFYNGTEAEFYTGSLNFKDKIVAAHATYGVTQSQSDALEVSQSAYAVAYLSAINPDTRTKGVVAARNAAKASLMTIVRDIALIVQGTSTVTDQQKIDLGLNVRKQKSPVPPPTDRPDVDLVSVVGRTVTIRIHDSISPTKRGKPDGTAAAWVYTFVGDNYPSDPTAWAFQGSTSKPNYDITFPDTVAGGARVWVCAAWINPKQETGPVSMPVSTHVQVGAVNLMQMKMAA